jgi:hypothetical protein
LTRISGEHQVSKEEFEAMKQKLVEIEEWKRLIERTITDKEIIETEYKRLVIDRYAEAEKTEKPKEGKT